MSLINYHNHTYLCKHATGTIEEYIKTAIDKNISELGFSDHAPLPEHMREGITMEPEELELYFNEILRHKETYKDKIDIKLGLEVDFPLRASLKRRYLEDNRLDYLIGSCHFIDDWPFDQEPYIDEFGRRDIDVVYRDYYNIIEALVEAKLFNLVGHFDLVKKFGHRPKKDFSKQIEKIAKKMAASDTAAEINTSGLIKPVKEIYPSEDIIKIFYNNNVPVTISSDSHAPEHIDYMLAESVQMLKKTGYKKISGFTKRKRYDILI